MLRIKPTVGGGLGSAHVDIVETSWAFWCSYTQRALSVGPTNASLIVIVIAVYDIRCYYCTYVDTKYTLIHARRTYIRLSLKCYALLPHLFYVLGIAYTFNFDVDSNKH